MGNCQAAEAATVVMLHPGGRIERIHRFTTACEVMVSNPGHYVAIVLTPPPPSPSPSPSEAPRRHLKLLRPEDPLRVGNVYRLVSFEEVVKGMGSKRHAKLRRLLLSQQLKEGGGGARDGEETGGDQGAISSEPAALVGAQGEQRQQEEEATEQQAPASGVRAGGVVGSARRRQWRPALQSIDEVGSG